MSNQTACETPHVLVIDDEAGIRQSVRFALDSFCTVSTASSVLAGLEVMSQNHIDTIVLDLRMPGLSGIDGLREIRKIDKAVSIIILTAYGSLETAQEAIRLGANDYQLKPFDVPQFVRVIRENINLTRKRREKQEEKKEVNDKGQSKIGRRPELGELVSNTLKDIEAPLRAMGLHLQLIRHNLAHYAADPDSLEEIVNKKFNSLHQSLRLSWEMVRSWQESNEGMIPGFEAVKMGDLLRDADLMLQPECIKQRVKISMRPPSEPFEVWGNRILLLGAVYNIVRKAIQGSPANGTVAISWRKGELESVCEISHAGKPATDPGVKHVFENFAGSVSEGAGVYRAKSIIDCHEGRIEVETNVHRGTTFRITLPAYTP